MVIHSRLIPVAGALGFVLTFGDCTRSENERYPPSAKDSAMSASGAQNSEPARSKDSASPLATLDTPTTIAVVEHADEGDYVSVVDIATGHLQRVTKDADKVRRPLWSSSGRFLLYQSGRAVKAYVDGEAAQSVLVEGIDPQASTSYATSADDAWIATALPEAVGLVRSPPANGTDPGVRRISLPPGCKVSNLLWSRDAATVLGLCGSAKTPDVSRLARIDVASGASTTQELRSVGRLLGWNPKSGALVVTRSESAKEDVGEVGTDGTVHTVRELSEGEYVLQYIPSANLVVTTRAVDDQSDSAHVYLVTDQGTSPRRWLEHFPRLRDLEFSTDGRWAVFINRTDEEAEGGDVYLTAVGSDEARRVLKAVPGEVSFSSPTVRPRMRKQ